jgi:hypothetical protein
MERHRELMGAAIQRDGVAQRTLLAGDEQAARVAFAEAAALYRQSWEVAPPASYGRLVGMLKSTVLAGEGEEEAANYVLGALKDEDDESATAAYARTIAALIVGDDEQAQDYAARMRAGPEAFVRTADAIAAIAAGDRAAYTAEINAIVRDFETRSSHLTGVAIADTALMLERLAARRGLSAGVRSRVLPRS